VQPWSELLSLVANKSDEEVGEGREKDVDEDREKNVDEDQDKDKNQDEDMDVDEDAVAGKLGAASHGPIHDVRVGNNGIEAQDYDDGDVDDYQLHETNGHHHALSIVLGIHCYILAIRIHQRPQRPGREQTLMGSSCLLEKKTV
jgi:hypothetical protein